MSPNKPTLDFGCYEFIAAKAYQNIWKSMGDQPSKESCIQQCRQANYNWAFLSGKGKCFCSETWKRQPIHIKVGYTIKDMRTKVNEEDCDEEEELWVMCANHPLTEPLRDLNIVGLVTKTREGDGDMKHYPCFYWEQEFPMGEVRWIRCLPNAQGDSLKIVTYGRSLSLCEVAVFISDPGCYENVGETYSGPIYLTRKNQPCLSGTVCGNGAKVRDRPWCFYEENEWDFCAVPPCKQDFDASFTKWSDWGPCENNIQKQTRTCNKAKYGGSSCHIWNTEKTRNCPFQLKLSWIPGVNCKRDELGRNYRGNASYTKAGSPCLPWNRAPGGSFDVWDVVTTNIGTELATNLCRNPDSSPKGPWCYTVDLSRRWDYCDVKLCSEVEADAEDDGDENENIDSRETTTRVVDEAVAYENNTNTIYQLPWMLDIQEDKPHNHYQEEDTVRHFHVGNVEESTRAPRKATSESHAVAWLVVVGGAAALVVGVIYCVRRRSQQAVGSDQGEEAELNGTHITPESSFDTEPGNGHVDNSFGNQTELEHFEQQEDFPHEDSYV